jgi:DNA-binding transcriptional LysR family regulator
MTRVDLNLLAVFEAVVRTRSVSHAAAEHGVSKAAMSHALARLRREVGDPILVRSGQEWRLTERARSMQAELADVTEAARRLLSPPSAFDPKVSSREFLVHTTDVVVSLLGVRLGHALTEEAPSMAFRFLPILPDDSSALRDGGVDLAIGAFAGLAAEFRRQTLFEDRLACVVRQGHPRVEDRMTMKCFLSLKHLLIAPHGRPGGIVDDALALQGLTRRIARFVPFYLVALDLVAQTDCIVTMSERLAHANAERFKLQVLRPPLPLKPYQVAQVWHPRVDADPAHAWFRKLVVQAAMPLKRKRRT